MATGMRVASMLLICAIALEAQSLRGTVLRGAHGVAGAVVILRDSSGATVSRALSHDAGEFFITAPRPGRYQVQVLRIGYAPSIAGFHELAAGTAQTATLRIESLPVQLERETVEGQKVCPSGRDSAAVAFGYWEQARTALLAATLTQATPYEVRLTSWDRNADGIETRRSRTGRSTRPYVSRPADSLAARGYILEDGSGTVYWAPDAEVLLSPSFATTHCFAVASGTSRNIIIAFEPVRGERDAADIRGDIILDRRSKYLRRLEFRYVGGAPMVEQSQSGGFVAFAPLPDGGWITPHWEIRLPTAVNRRGSGDIMMPGQRRVEPGQIIRTRTFGGDIERVARNDRVLWEPGRIPISVDVRDSSGHAAPAGTLVWIADDSSARLPATDDNGLAHLENVAEGNRRVKILTPSLDSLGLPAFEASVSADSARREPIRVVIPSPAASPRLLCGGQTSTSAPGMLYGAARFGVVGADTMTAVAIWQTLSIRSGSGAVVGTETRRIPVGLNGRYHLCALPVGKTIRVHIALGSQRSAPSVVELTPERDVAWLPLSFP